MTIPTLYSRDHSGRGRLLFTGRDRQSFLQGMVTNDVTGLTPGKGCYAFLLDATGHILADTRILCAEDYLLLDVEPGMAGTVLETLEQFHIMERVKMADASGAITQLHLGGVDAPAALLALNLDTSSWREGDNAPLKPGEQEVLVAASRWNALPGFELYGSPEAIQEAASRLATADLAPEVFEGLRVEGGVPRFGTDMDSRVLALETGQRERAISFKKGCYIGQEIVARIDARGRVNREFCGFQLSGDALPAPETPVLLEGKEVGRVTSAALGPTLDAPLALGYIRRELSEPGTRVQIAGHLATVAGLPFTDLPVKP